MPISSDSNAGEILASPIMILAGFLLTLVLSAAEPSASFMVICAIIADEAVTKFVIKFSLRVNI